MAWAASGLIAVIGIGVLTGLTFGATAQSSAIAVVLPPWRSDGLAHVAQTPAAIVDLRWGGHLVIVAPGNDPATVAMLRQQGLWLLDATVPLACAALPQEV